MITIANLPCLLSRSPTRVDYFKSNPRCLFISSINVSVCVDKRQGPLKNNHSTIIVPKIKITPQYSQCSAFNCLLSVLLQFIYSNEDSNKACTFPLADISIRAL